MSLKHQKAKLIPGNIHKKRILKQVKAVICQQFIKYKNSKAKKLRDCRSDLSAVENLLLVLPSLPEAPGFAVLSLSLLERGSGAAFVPQRCDGALLKPGLRLRRDVGWSWSADGAFHLRQLQIHLLTADENTQT